MIRAIAVAGLVASFAANAADIQKCADGSGGVVYQDSPCPRGSTIGTLPRETGQADPAALRRLEQERARLERSADAQIAAQRQEPQAAPMPAASMPGQLQAGVPGYNAGTPTYNSATPTYTTPVYGVDPATGALLVPGPNGTVQTVQPAITQSPAAGTQPLSANTQPAGITQPPAGVPSSVTQVPSAPGAPNVLVPATPAAAGVAPAPTLTPTPAIIQSPVAGRPR